MSLFNFELITEDEVTLKAEFTGETAVLTIKGETEDKDSFVEISLEEGKMLATVLNGWSYSWPLGGGKAK